MKEIKVGILGAGPFGRDVHFPALSYIQKNYGDKFKLTLEALCEMDEEVAQEVSSKYNF